MVRFLPPVDTPSSFDTIKAVFEKHVGMSKIEDLKNFRDTTGVAQTCSSGEFDNACLASEESVRTQQPQLQVAAWPFDPLRAWSHFGNKYFALVRWENHTVANGK
uniref:Uncharacterized protein n=1 Tax=Odontella aurita TaxID=265563 RepID=A0A7S4IML1_9STRA|mmetsp:Transcript_27483/g.80834  ORF Transcript_27483/g.80834 Transcript_27483/m.80834 type:complete len:105 (+) Transcript_27483:1547-1861(+)